MPYFGLSDKDQAELDKYKPLAKVLNYVVPNYKFDVRKGRKLENWILNWADDPLYTGTKISVSSILLNEKLIQQFNETVADKVSTPFLVLLAGKDGLVSNKAAKHFFENSMVTDKDLIEFDQADHSIIQDAEYWPSVAQEIISW